MILFLAYALAVATGALVLLVLGMRGRRVDDHPVCRRCGFDLVGPPGGTATCSECGADLVDRRRAVRAIAGTSGDRPAGNPRRAGFRLDDVRAGRPR
ncbi:MAG TPA: hypothetical protein VER17_15540 [Tepidisphaeraceae bacterium]|nr:hypothetical protein [Tepidisphaeraceae bacterium]